MLAFGALVFVGLVIFGYNNSRQLPPQSETKQTTPTSTVTGVTTQNTTVNTLQPTKTPGLSLSISTPINQAKVNSSRLTIIGKTAPRAEVFVNDGETIADSAGNFRISIVLDEGDNIIAVMANDALGNSAEQDLIVTYTPSQ